MKTEEAEYKIKNRFFNQPKLKYFYSKELTKHNKTYMVCSSISVLTRTLWEMTQTWTAARETKRIWCVRVCTYVCLLSLKKPKRSQSKSTDLHKLRKQSVFIHIHIFGGDSQQPVNRNTTSRKREMLHKEKTSHICTYTKKRWARQADEHGILQNILFIQRHKYKEAIQS